MVYGLDVEETVSRIRSGWNSGALELVLAGKGDMEMVVSGAGKLTMPHAEWDASISLDASCVDALNAAFDDLRAFHFNFSSDDRQFNAAAQLLWDALPLEKSPILT